MELLGGSGHEEQRWDGTRRVGKAERERMGGTDAAQATHTGQRLPVECPLGDRCRGVLRDHG